MSEPAGSEDPLSSDNIQTVMFIQQSRIYDVLIALLAESNPEAARNILQMHAEGHLVGPSPQMSGVFVTDEQNASPSGEQNHSVTDEQNSAQAHEQNASPSDEQ